MAAAPLAGETPAAATDNVLVDLFGRVTSLGAVYNDAQMVGSRFAALACVITARCVYLHMRWNAYPHIRASIVVILLLVPVYAVDASLGLQYMRLEVPRQMLRQAYEAYVLLSFMRLMLDCLGECTSPRLCLPGSEKRAKGVGFVRAVRLGVWQYVILCGMFNTTVAILAWSIGLYHDGRFHVSDAYLYCTALQFFSQWWALWSMVQLLHYTRRELAPVRPLLKFFCVKLIIFATWLQTVAILMLENVSSLGMVSLWIEREHQRTISHWWDPFRVFDTTYVEKQRLDAWQERHVRSRVGMGLGNLVLCVEMVAFATLHWFAYPVSEWDPCDEACAGHRLVVLHRDGVHPEPPRIAAPLLPPQHRGRQGEEAHRVGLDAV